MPLARVGQHEGEDEHGATAKLDEQAPRPEHVEEGRDDHRARQVEPVRHAGHAQQIPGELFPAEEVVVEACARPPAHEDTHGEAGEEVTAHDQVVDGGEGVHRRTGPGPRQAAVRLVGWG